MVVISKFWFDKLCSTCSCHQAVHPWAEKCTDGSAMMFASCIKGAYKFYAIIYMVQILLKGKKLSTNEMLEQFKMYLKSGAFGLIVSCSFVPLHCIFRRLFTKNCTYYGTVLLPCTLNGLAVYFEPPYRRILVANFFVTLVFEYWVKSLELKGWLRRTPGKETLIFMLGNAIFFYLIRINKDSEKRTPLSWIFTPPRVSKEVGKPISGFRGRNPACPHSGSCMKYVLKGTAQLFGVGCAMTMLRQILPRILTPTKALKALKLSHLKLGIFFGGYIGIYRLIVCMLCRANGRDSALYALPAGFLAGAAFRASPSTAIAMVPITSTLQILGSWGYQNGLIPEQLPLPEILYCLAQGLLFHARLMHEDVCPRYIVNLLHNVSCNKADLIQQGFVQRIYGSNELYNQLYL